MNQIENITLMEQNLNDALDVLENFDKVLEAYIAVQEKIDGLKAYYGSPAWWKDMADDEAGKLPSDLPRGVLSEDGIYNLLADNEALIERMREFLYTDNKQE